MAWDFLPFSQKHPQIGLLPKTLPVCRDLTLLLEKSISFLQLQKVLTVLELHQLKDFFLFDVYQGEHLPAGKKSYALGFLLQDEHTLEQQEISALMDQILQNLVRSCGAVLG